ncbi:MAG TPA: aspartate aminotransferase [Rhodobiaceae bacterium]|nr:MAG: LL-diaminopimelate aminotransferase [Rhodobiaceae bacterium UBA7378]HCQ81581.1 aspartate aminotransferase [Rhodobiaceae bacterium]
MPDRFGALPPSPFVRLRALLDDVTPAQAPVSLAIGEPRHAPPPHVLAALSAASDSYGKYPPIGGTADWRIAVSGWLSRRFDVSPDLLAETSQILPLNGTREGLFLAAQIAPQKEGGLVMMPNPFYQVYAAAALAAGATPVYLPATAATGYLPDLDALDTDTLDRTQAFYFCSPANPQGAVADATYLARLVALARAHNFLLLVDECYAEIYDTAAPASALEVMQAASDDDMPVMVFHSLSKRSNLPGLRSGFCAGGRAPMQAMADLRGIAGPQSPLAVQAAAALAWSDDAHVDENRQKYRQKFDAAASIFGTDNDFYRPAGGFFLWLNVGDGVAAARHLWAAHGVRVLPGAYLARPGTDGAVLGSEFIRVALVEEQDAMVAALQRLKDGIDNFVSAAKGAA